MWRAAGIGVPRVSAEAAAGQFHPCGTIPGHFRASGDRNGSDGQAPPSRRAALGG